MSPAFLYSGKLTIAGRCGMSFSQKRMSGKRIHTVNLPHPGATSTTCRSLQGLNHDLRKELQASGGACSGNSCLVVYAANNSCKTRCRMTCSSPHRKQCSSTASSMCGVSLVAVTSSCVISVRKCIAHTSFESQVLSTQRVSIL